jgi:septum formation protein
MRKIILASTSRWRKEILEKSRLPFVVEPSDYEEDMTLALAPRELAETLATGKAEAVAVRHADAIVIGADTFIEYDGGVLGKPGTKEKAKEVLRNLSGKSHPIHTGYCVIDTKTGEHRSGTVTTIVTFRDLPEDEMDAYVATGEAENAGGGYTLQGGAAGFVKHIDGDFYNIVGFPLWKIIEELRHFGVQY